MGESFAENSELADSDVKPEDGSDLAGSLHCFVGDDVDNDDPPCALDSDAWVAPCPSLAQSALHKDEVIELPDKVWKAPSADEQVHLQDKRCKIWPLEDEEG